ncbi:MAG: hypothetical protein K9H26_04335 [Prolixibacteraceae bacterium]|nr:hypothetical protein [Prolixibacteraceae bacterium]
MELNSTLPGTGKSSFQSYFPPILLERKKNKEELYVIDCDNETPYLMGGDELEQFVKAKVHIIDPGKIKKITTTSDIDVAPVEYIPQPPEGKLACNRYRNAIKIETRGMLGFRPWWLTEESITYPGPEGDAVYNRKFSSLGTIGSPNGTIITLGLEAALLPRLFKIGDNHSLNLGPMLGIWPVDGGLYIPLSIHPRFTFNDITTPLWRNCNAFYLFGDIGTAYDALGNIPFTYKNELTSTFWGIGVGFDLWKTRGRDLSFDIGYRFTNLSLPQNLDYINCLKENGINADIPNPVRATDQFFIRVGFTW